MIFDVECCSMFLGFHSSFFFQAEDGIRDIGVTGVQTCALPISLSPSSYIFPFLSICAPVSSKVTQTEALFIESVCKINFF